MLTALTRRHRDGPLAPLTLLSALLLLFLPGAALAVAVDIGDGSGTVGDVIDVPVTVDDLTGLGVTAYELRVTWSAARATLVDAPTTGTLTQPWGTVTVNATAGEVIIAASGVTALSGAGTLLFLQFELGPSSGGTTLALQEFIFNEGTPTAELTHGYLSVSALPTINLSPDSGEIAIGETLAMAVSGGTPPYTLHLTDPTVASPGVGFITGIDAGRTRVWAEDAVGVTETTTGFIDVRVGRLSAGSVPGVPGQMIWVPITLTMPAGWDFRALEFSLTWTASRLEAVGATLGGGLISGWGSAQYSIGPGRIDVAAAGVDPIPGSGVLAYVLFNVTSSVSTTQPLYLVDGLLDEEYPTVETNGSAVITAPPVITVYPDTDEIVVGDTQAFTISGTVSPPVTWGVTDGAVASIDASGVLTALTAGTVRVWAEDNAGAVDTTGTITVCDFYLLGPDKALPNLDMALVPIRADRELDALGIYGYEIRVAYNPDLLTALGATSSGCASSGWGTPVFNAMTGEIIIVHAGADPLVGNDPIVNVVFMADPSLYGTTTGVTVTKHLFNEGSPCALVVNGTISLPSGVPDAGPLVPTLRQNVPNPFNPSTEIRYDLPRGGHATLRIYAADGRLVRTLFSREHAAGHGFTAVWDGRDDGGRRVASGVYGYRLDSSEGSDLRKMTLLK